MDEIVKIIGEEAHRDKTMVRNEKKYKEVLLMHSKLKNLLQECNADYTIQIEMDEVFHTTLFIRIETTNFDIAPIVYDEYRSVIDKGNSICQQVLTNGKMEIELAIHDVYKEI